jgi:hypothetical protein
MLATQGLYVYKEGNFGLKQIFTIACDFAARVAVAELTFRPDPAVWELIA